MSLLIDLILVAVMVFCTVYYGKKGFAASLVGFARFWIALGLALLFSGSLAEKLQPFVNEKLGTGEGDSFLSSIVEKMLSSGYVARILAFAILFAAGFLAVKLLELFLRMVVKLPVIHTLNNALGTVLGVLVGFFWISLLSLILMTLAEVLAGSVSWLSPKDFENTVLAKFLYENNFFRLIFEKLSNG